MCEEMYEPGELEPSEVRAEILTQTASLDSEKADWPEVTDCDKLENAFEWIEGAGIITLQNAGYTQSDGYEDICEIYRRHSDRASVLGYCYYHGQDLDRAVAGEGLYLSFGPMNPKDETTVGVRVGEAITAQLRRAGLEPEWNGSFNKRIYIKALDWKRRF